jgi:hypothetical protein
MFGVSVPQELSRGKYLSENIGQFTENRKQIEEDRLKGPGAFYCSNICHLFSDFCLLTSESSDFQVIEDLVVKLGQPHRHEVIDDFKILES